MALTRAAAHELGPHGITVNCLCPGYVLDEMGAAGARARARRLVVGAVPARPPRRAARRRPGRALPRVQRLRLPHRRRAERLRRDGAALTDSARLAAVRAEDWDERYAEQQQWSAEPNRLVAELLADLPPGTPWTWRRGRGGTRSGWPGRGWRVTAVDFSGVGLDRGPRAAGCRRASPGSPPTSAPGRRRRRAWTWCSSPTCTCPQDDTAAAARRGRSAGCGPAAGCWSSATTSRTSPRGVGGPQEPAILHSVERLAPGRRAAGRRPAGAGAAGDAGGHRAGHPAVGTSTGLNRRSRR